MKATRQHFINFMESTNEDHKLDLSNVSPKWVEQRLAYLKGEYECKKCK